MTDGLRLPHLEVAALACCKDYAKSCTHVAICSHAVARKIIHVPHDFLGKSNTCTGMAPDPSSFSEGCDPMRLWWSGPKV